MCDVSMAVQCIYMDGVVKEVYSRTHGRGEKLRSELKTNGC